ncbi:MAG: recombinase family protein [Eubacterium sp.]|nr:recombinase family protein [Eubacterium sp.]
MIYGYARVSTRGQARDGNSLEAQIKQLKDNGAEKLYIDTYTGTKIDRPEFDKLRSELKTGDILIVTKLDRFARSASQGIELINSLIADGVKVNILNMGQIDDTATGKLIRNIMLCFAEFERDMIVQRTMEGKACARLKPGYREGRKPVYDKERIGHALELLKDHSYKQVEELTGISKSTLIRAKRRLMIDTII